MDREVFFDWLDAMVLSDDSRGLWWQVAQDDVLGADMPLRGTTIVYID